MFENNKPEFITGIFTIIAALISGLVTYIVTKKHQHKSKLSLISKRSIPLLEVSDIIKKKIKISIDEQVVTELHMCELIINNIGNTTIKELKVKLTPSASSKIINIELKNTNVIIEDSDYSLSSQYDKIEIKYLNPKDRLTFIILTDKKSEIGISFRQSQVDASIKTNVSDTSIELKSTLIESLSHVLKNYYKLNM